MTIVDRVRVENAVQTFDFWLELRGVSWRRRRELRRELRDNLAQAGAEVGVTAALFGIGSPKQLAYDSAPAEPARPRWSLGALWGVLTFSMLGLGVLYTSATVLQSVRAAGVVGTDVHTSVLPWFGVDFLARVDQGGGISAGASGSGWYALVPVGVFLLASQPWRLLRHRSGVAAPAERG
jgi:hypothetical protein